MDYNDLAAQLPAVRHFLETVARYDDVYGLEFKIHELDGIGTRLDGCTNDDFQRKLARDHEFHHGYFQLEFESIDDLWRKLRERPSRAERELTVLLRQTASAIEGRESLTNEAARAFAERLVEEHRRNQHLLTDLTARSPIERTTDDEIPF